MANKDSFQKYLDVGIAFTNLTRTRAEELVADLVQNGEFRGDARAKVDELIERSRKSREALFAQVRHEVDRQLESVGITDLEDLAKQVAALIGRTAEAGRTAAAKKAPAKRAAAKKSASRPAGKKAVAKKAPAKRAAAKKSPARKAAATPTAGRRATAKKAAKKAPATKKSGSGAAG